MSHRVDRVQLKSAEDAAKFAAIVNDNAVRIRASTLAGENAVTLTDACDYETLKRLAAEAGISLGS